MVHYWFIDPSSTLHEEYTIIPLTAVSQGTGRGETNLPDQLSAYTSHVPCHDAVETCTSPHSLSTYLPSPAAHPASTCPSSCGPFGFSIDQINSFIQISPLQLEGKICAFNNLYKQLKMDTFNRKGCPTLRVSTVLLKDGRDAALGHPTPPLTPSPPVVNLLPQPPMLLCSSNFTE